MVAELTYFEVAGRSKGDIGGVSDPRYDNS
jgi:hypothetical protein